MGTRLEALQTLARDWYLALDVHAGYEEKIRPMLALDGLEMVFPEATVYGLDGFLGWYEGVIRIFFDEAHTVQSVTVQSESGDSAVVGVVVRWEASRWQPPAAASQRIKLLAYQTWTVSFAHPEKPVITRYTVDRLEYLPGSATL